MTSNVDSIAAGTLSTCAVTSTGAGKSWGWNDFGQLGDGTIITRMAPVDISGLSSGVDAVSGGGGEYDTGFSCALTSAGGAKCWGANSSGELGDNQNCGVIYCTTPQDVSGLSSGTSDVSAGGYHACALTTIGGVKCWGRNDFGQLGDSSTITQLTPVDVLWTPACSDLSDNDGDTLTDWPDDPGCDDMTDISEYGTNECDDGVDNDGDTLIDWPDDPECVDIADNSEL